jgi:aspartyl-tRNA(Asn)/glutamyl-tRNA(Gln) amidotransferase subunit A
LKNLALARRRRVGMWNLVLCSLRSHAIATSLEPKSPIDGFLIAAKDNICTSDLPTTCASSILQGFMPRQGAQALHRLQNDGGALVVGKANMDEFGMGSHSTHSAYGPVQNFVGNAARSAGGSSGGSAVAVATDQCYLALGTDTGGSVRLPAAYTGLAGFKPSYGMISRQGVVPYANSLDTVGIMARSCFDILNAFSE